MSLPVEVREIIYQHLFRYDKPLYISRAGRLIVNREARRDMRILRTCRAFYIEAVPQIHAVNTMEIKHRDMAALSRLPKFAEILVGKVVIHGDQLQDHSSEPITGPIAGLVALDGSLTNEIGHGVEEIGLGTIGRACPNVTDIEILTYFSGSLLWVTQKLLKSLPCSPIREWPLLRVDVTISEDSAFDNAKFSTRSKKVIHGGDGLSWLNARSSFRLGHEMPKSLRSIRIQGTASKRIAAMIQDHTCSFGDCSFEKTPLSDSTQHKDLAGTDKGETNRYTWHKTGKFIGLNFDVMDMELWMSMITLNLSTTLTKYYRRKHTTNRGASGKSHGSHEPVGSSTLPRRIREFLSHFHCVYLHSRGRPRPYENCPLKEVFATWSMSSKRRPQSGSNSFYLSLVANSASLSVFVADSWTMVVIIWWSITNDRAQERMAHCGYDISPDKLKPFIEAKLPQMGMDISS
jgi:hypothetical protein